MGIDEAQLAKLRQKGRIRDQGSGGDLGGRSVECEGARNGNEHKAQAQLIKMADKASVKYPELALLNGSLNGVRLTIGQAKKAKASGMRRGYPDLFLPVGRKGYFGLFIELKVGKNRTTPDQKGWLKALKEQGYYCSVCYGTLEAWDEIINYLENV